MNVVDLIIIGSIGLLALVGLKGGIIRPASGIGGMVLGVMMGLNYQAEMAAVLAPHLNGDVVARVAGFTTVAVLVFALTKAGALVLTKAIPGFKMGLADHLAGAFGAIVVGVLVLGTMMYLMIGVNVAPTRDVLDSSLLAPKVAMASLVSPSVPWCSSLDSGNGENCRSYTGLIGGMIGVDINAKMQEMAGDQDVDTIMSIVKATLSGGVTEDLVQIANKPHSALATDTVGAEFVYYWVMPPNAKGLGSMPSPFLSDSVCLIPTLLRSQPILSAKCR